MTAHLFIRSSYTLLNSTIRIDELCRRAKELGFSALALTDRNVMYGMAEFIRAAAKYGLRGIAGLEIEVFYHDERVPFVLLAKDNAGYLDLIRLSSSLCGEREYCLPEDLWKCAAHCFIIAFSEGGWIDGELVRSDFNEVRKKLEMMKAELPAFDLALSYMDASLWRERNPVLKRVASSLGIRTLALNKVFYLEKDDAEAYRALSAIRLSTTLQDHALPVIRGRYLLSEEEMEALYEADDLKRTDEIASQCRADYNLEKTSLPIYDTGKGIPASEYLPQLCAAGLKKRLNGHVPENYVRRLKYELDIIGKMHFEDYFMIVYDFIRYSRSENIYIGPGRGSAAGSLVSWCLGITQVDPVRYGLLFERFLNPERVTMPDIDTDIPDNRRDDVIRYVLEKYGPDHVAGIITFGTFGAKQVIRDMAKISGLSGRDTDMLTRLIPNLPQITLKTALEKNPRLKQAVASDSRFVRLFALAEKLEGLPRHASTHAAGVLLSRKPLNEIVPTMRQGDGMLNSQYTAGYLEERGLIKMDFLGLRNLTIIDEIVTDIRKQDLSFSIMQIPMDNRAAYEVFKSADTTGIFQFESAGMQNLLRKMKPERFEDIVAALALYRPASADSIPSYLAGKNDPSSVRYPDERLKGILKETYGVMIYQEQAMLASEICAGFTLSRADTLRKAMSKKNEKELSSMHDEFIRGCEKGGMDHQKAEDLFALVSRFSGYGFNKSHAVAYGIISYQMAYLKANYPLRFYTCLLNSVIGDENRTAQYMAECRRRGIRILYPDVCRSDERYVVTRDGILPPLSIVKGIGASAASTIRKEREQNGVYDDFYDFTARMTLIKISQNDIISMIKAGALDTFGMGRKTMLESMDEAMSYAQLVQVKKNGVMTIDTSLVSKPAFIRMKDERFEISQMEREALGFNIGEQPIVVIRQSKNIHVPPIAAIRTMQGVCSGFAMIANTHQHKTKRGDMMVFLKLSDETGEIDMAVMPRLYAAVGQSLRRGTYILFDAKISDDGSLLADRIAVVSAK